MNLVVRVVCSVACGCVWLRGCGTCIGRNRASRCFVVVVWHALRVLCCAVLCVFLTSFSCMP